MASIEGSRGALRVLGKAVHVVLRGFGWLFLVAVLIVGGIGVYVYRRFSPEDARRLAVEQLTALLHREVTIERLVLTPHGLKVKGLRVRRGRQGGEADVLSCDSALVTIKLMPLLQRRLELDTVLLESPQISLLCDAEGHWDFYDLFGSTQAAESQPAPLPLVLAAAETVVQDGILRVDDRLHGRTISLKQLSLRVDGFNQERPFPVEASFSSVVTFASRTVTTAVSAKGAVDLASLRWSSATARADRFTAVINGVELRGSVWARGFPGPRVEADISAPALGPESWRRLGGFESALSLPKTRWRVKTDVPAPGMMELEKLTVETPAGGASASGLLDLGAETPALSLEIDARDIALERVASWHPAWTRRELAGRATARVAVTGWPGRLQAREAELSLRGFSAVQDGKKLEDVDLDATAAAEFSRLTASVSKGRLTAFGDVFDQLSIALAVDKQNLAVKRLALRWGGANVDLKARIEQLSAPKEVVLSGSVDKLDWEKARHLAAEIAASVSTRTTNGSAESGHPWVRTFKYSIPRSFPDTVGHVRLGEVSHPNFWCRDVDLIWSLRGVTPALDRVGGEARLRFGPGRVADIPAVQNAHKFLRVVFLPFVFMHKMNNLSVFSTETAYPKTLDFTRIEGEYGVSRGVADIRYFHVDSGQLVAYAEGQADFGREKVDMNILTRLTSYRGTLPEWWVDEAGRPAIGFRVKGDLNKPELEPRFKKIEEGEIEQKAEEGRARAQKRFEALEKRQTL